MVAVRELPLASKNQKPAAKTPAGKAHTWEQRKKDVQSIAVARDLAQWITDIGVYATRKLKRTGRLTGKARVNNALIVDPYLREVVWELRQRCRNLEEGTPNAPIPPCPPCKLPPLDVELP